jgi:hypothetical protein
MSQMVRLYRSSVHPRHWVAYVPGTGWMAFPDRENGWEERHPARGLDPLYLREVPLQMAAKTGMLESELVAQPVQAA